MLKRNLLILIAISIVLLASQGFAAEGGKVDMAENLQQVSEEALTKKLPVLMFFAGVECEYCELLEQDHLAGMARSSSYKDKVIIRKVFVDGYENIRDFQGNKISTDKFSDRFSIRVTPTLVLVNHQGKPLGKKILGYNRSDFFGFYLDEAIAEATKQIN